MNSAYLRICCVLLLIQLHWSCTNKLDNSFPKVVYQSDTLVITQLTEHVFQHTSYLSTNDFGKVDCNGMVVVTDHEAVVIDTPVDSIVSATLIHWIQAVQKSKIKAVVPTHFHVDCLGGLNAFRQVGVASLAHAKTKILAIDNNFNIPQSTFEDSFIITLGIDSILVKYFGEGHTIDNVVAYYAKDKVLFGGCLIKELGAGKGNLADANVNAWYLTVDSIKSQFTNINYIIPGHGKVGDTKLLDYTMDLFH